MSVYCPLKDGPALYPECTECRRDGLAICDFFFLLVAGGRDFDDYGLMCRKLDAFLANKPDVVIISGGARGADKLARAYAMRRNFLFMEFPAKWDELGKKAGFVRNEEMHQYLGKQKNRGIVLFWDGKSKGTAHNIELAETESHAPVRVVKYRKEDV